MVIARGEQMLADDILRLNFLPIGTILMFDGNNWVDDTTVPGWYACTAANVGQGCPDLTNKFIKGGNSAKGNTANGTSGAENHQVTIGTNNLPAHTHAIGSHTHSVSGSAGKTTDLSGTWAEDSNSTDPSGIVSRGGGAGRRSAGDSGGAVWMTVNANHEHTISGTAAAATSGNTGDNTTTAVKLNIEPRSYALIFIRKCA